MRYYVNLFVGGQAPPQCYVRYQGLCLRNPVGAQAALPPTQNLDLRDSKLAFVYTTEFVQAAPPPPKRQVSVAGSRVAVRITVRSTSAEIVSAIEADKAAFVEVG